MPLIVPYYSKNGHVLPRIGRFPYYIHHGIATTGEEVPSDARLTEDGGARLTEDGGTRLTEDGT